MKSREQYAAPDFKHKKGGAVQKGGGSGSRRATASPPAVTTEAVSCKIGSKIILTIFYTIYLKEL